MFVHCLKHSLNFLSFYLQATDLLQGLIPSKDDKDQSSVSKGHYDRLYVFAIMWSIGAFLELDDRMKLEEFLRKSESFHLDLPDIPEGMDYTMFDYMVNDKGTSKLLSYACHNCD